MSFDMAEVTGILLADGWHDVVAGSMFADTGMTFDGPPGTAPVAPAGTWIAFTDTADGLFYALPLSPYTAVRYTPQPIVGAVTPTTGAAAGGTAVTVEGAGFLGATQVSFGGNAATGVTVVSQAEITCTSPPVTGTVDVTVTTPGGTSATGSADQYTGQ